MQSLSFLTMEPFFRIGVFANTHGLKGEIRVWPTTDDLTRFTRLETVFLDTKQDGRLELEVESVRYHKGMPVLRFRGYDEINKIEKYKGSDLLVRREDAIPLEEGEFYIADMVGAAVLDTAGNRIGTFKDVLQTGANDVYIVERTDGRELLIPAIPDCVKKKDVEHAEIVVELLPGLEDL